MAVAGFRPEDIEVLVKENTLSLTGRSASAETKSQVLYRGIAGRSFERRFALADHIVVDGADLQNGLLHVSLKRVVPEELKPRRIPVGAGTASQQVANDQAGAVKAA
jgi:molecular chaperone IbpA